MRQRFWGRCRHWMVRFLHDPPCQSEVHGRLLKMPLSHALPWYLERFPLYDSLLRRLSTYLHELYGPLSCVDVGANIGDSIAAVQQHAYDRFLAIEPNPHFIKYLRENFGDDSNVIIIESLCSSTKDHKKRRLTETAGTASLVDDAEGRPMDSDTLDSFVERQMGHPHVHFVKVDTDGHDFEVLKGATQLISTSRPAILFECDAFDNAHYVDDCMTTMRSLQRCGYSSALVYENTGHLLGSFSLDDLLTVRNLLFVQLTKGNCYYDVLVMKEPDVSQFLAREQLFFINRIPDAGVRAIAAKAT